MKLDSFKGLKIRRKKEQILSQFPKKARIVLYFVPIESRNIVYSIRNE